NRAWITSDRRDHRDPSVHEISRESRQTAVVAMRPAELDRDVLAFGEATLLQAATKRPDKMCGLLRRSCAHKPDHRHCCLLRTHRERPRHCCAAKNGDEIATPHSITSSARASREGGIERPRAFAVLRLKISSNFVGCCTERSPAAAPL